MIKIICKIQAQHRVSLENFKRGGGATALNTVHKRRSLRSLGLRHIFTSAIATVKTSYAPGTLCVIPNGGQKTS